MVREKDRITEQHQTRHQQRRATGQDLDIVVSAIASRLPFISAVPPEMPLPRESEPLPCFLSWLRGIRATKPILQTLQAMAWGRRLRVGSWA